MSLTTRFMMTVAVLLVSLPLAAATTATVNIQSFSFQPNTVTINLGDSVKWVNLDGVQHSTTENSNLWSQDLTTGANFTRVFNSVGTFSYHCRFHPSMTATVVVRSAEQTRIKIGKDIVTAAPKLLPITLNLTGRDPNQVYLGSYIVNAQSGCANCHSCPTYAVGHNPYKGEPKQFNATTYLAGGVAIQGMVSANLTPVAGKPAGLTLAQFKTLLRTGHDPDVPGAFVQVMPWPIFGIMSDYDLNAVYAYLQSIPTATTPTKACEQGQ